MINRFSQAGSLESGDALVRVSPTDDGLIAVSIESKVSPRFAKSMDRTVREIAAEFGVSAARFEVIDRGALDFVLRARLATAIRRAKEAGPHE